MYRYDDDTEEIHWNPRKRVPLRDEQRRPDEDPPGCFKLATVGLLVISGAAYGVVVLCDWLELWRML